MEIRHIATRDGRLSSFLKQELGLSTGLMNRLKWSQMLFVNGLPQYADYPVSKGDVITAVLDDPAPDYPAQDGNLDILYEDDHILCVDKPAGMLIHPSRSVNSGTLANYVFGYYKRTNQSCAFHPVTRLDRDTFGVVLLAKNAHIHSLFQRDGLQKTYEALVFGVPNPKEDIIDAPIARLPLPSLLRKVDESGKSSVTEYKVLAEYGGFSKLYLKPITGRTHQLRVHCSYLGFPILGDPQYGSEASQNLSHSLGIQTQALCAKSVVFSHPITGETLTITTNQTLAR